jgi:glycosyltransferase involved in cell wall biosynthesis
MKKISIIIPCYNSAVNIPDTSIELIKLKSEVEVKGLQVEFIMVEDGSTDNTMGELLRFKQKVGSDVKIIQLAGNWGSYNALLAGCHYATGDACVQLHIDLQDPPDHIPEMIDYWLKGNKLVIGQRIKREEDFFYLLTAAFYHWLIKKFALPYIPEGGYDLILFDRDICNHIVRMNETNTNLVYLMSWLRYPYVAIPIIRRKRVKGESGWTFTKRVKLVIDSFVSFSYFPIRVITFFALLSIFALLITTVMLFTYEGCDFKVWIISLLSTIILIGLSIVAEYLWRTLEATRKRPPFVVYKEILK